MHRFVVSASLNEDIIAINDNALSHQLQRVLRLNVGEQVALTNGLGTEVEATIIGYTKEGIQLAPAGKPTIVKLQHHTTLYLAIIKHDNFEDAVQKSVEAGIDAIVPIITARTIKKNINTPRLTKIIKEATEQSGRVFLAKLCSPITFAQALAQASGKKIMCDASGTALPPLAKEKEVSIFIGPEGGFMPEEVALAKQNKCAIVSLGSTVLRAETAATIGSYLISR